MRKFAKGPIVSTVQVFLVPILAMTFIGQLFRSNLLGQPWNWLLLITVWILGLIWVWRPARR